MITIHGVLKRIQRIGAVRLRRRKIVRRKKRGGRQSVSNRVTYLAYKEQAREFVHRKVKYWNTFYGFKIDKIYIKNQKTRWGSCSSKGNINFNYRIVLIPEYIADYIIVHELCHLGQFNHSEKFWNLVEHAIPKYRDCISELKKIPIL